MPTSANEATASPCLVPKVSHNAGLSGWAVSLEPLGNFYKASSVQSTE